MAVFEEVRVEWQGKEHVIPSGMLLRCIAQVEDVLTLGELAEMQRKGRLKFVQLSTAFAVVLRYAGVAVSDEEVYDEFFKGTGSKIKRQSFLVIASLQRLMIPPEHLQEKKPGKQDAAPAAASKPSGKSTNSSSAPAG